MNMIRPAMLVATVLLVIATVEAKTVNSLADLQWEKRIILVANPAHKPDIIDTLTRLREGIEERDIAWFVVAGDTLESNMPGIGPSLALSVRDVVETSRDQQEVVLIGKDGGVKDRSRQLDMERLFSLIDSMPMRRQEMRPNED